MHTHTHIHTHTHAMDTHTRTRTQTHICMHAHMHMHTHAHAHTHTHILAGSLYSYMTQTHTVYLLFGLPRGSSVSVESKGIKHSGASPPLASGRALQFGKPIVCNPLNNSNLSHTSRQGPFLIVSQ